MSSPLPALVDEAIASLADRPDSSARVLLVTVFGDSLHPRGEAVWLTSLATLLAPFGVSDRLVRTSVQRLVGEGILERTPSGRRSFYSVTDEARADFEQAESRIYHRRPPEWDGRWTLVVVPSVRVEAATRARLANRLGWLGFDAVVPGMLASPSLSADAAHDVINSMGLAGEVAVLDAGANDAASGPLLTRLSGAFDTAAELFGSFAERYRDIAATMGEAVELTDQQAFCLRTLIVHDYRRAALVDPALPQALLPDQWPGDRAFTIARAVYPAIGAAADRYVEVTCEGVDGAIGAPGAWTTERFRDDHAS